jgi:chromosome segregation ATPase
MSDAPNGPVLAAIAALDAKIGTLDDKIGALDAKIGALDDKLDAKVGALDAKLSAKIDRRASEIMDRVDGLSGHVAQLREEVFVNFGAADRAVDLNTHTREEVASLTKLVSAMQRQIHLLDGRVAGLEERQGGSKPS